MRFFSYEKDNNRCFCTISKTFDADGIIDGIVSVHGDNLQVYSGYSKFLMKNGIGKLTKPDGEVYVGEFRDDSFNGKGILTLPDGTV